jgi:hypothetical protein
MPAIYPSSLPEFVLQDGYSEKLNSQTIETQMETGGSPKIRRRFTRKVKTFQVTILLDAAQLATFESFWESTLSGGSLPFEWVHPLTRLATTFRFRNPPPGYTNQAGVYTRVSFTLETV